MSERSLIGGAHSSNRGAMETNLVAASNETRCYIFCKVWTGSCWLFGPTHKINWYAMYTLILEKNLWMSPRNAAENDQLLRGLMHRSNTTALSVWQHDLTLTVTTLNTRDLLKNLELLKSVCSAVDFSAVESECAVSVWPHFSVLHHLSCNIY